MLVEGGDGDVCLQDLANQGNQFTSLTSTRVHESFRENMCALKGLSTNKKVKLERVQSFESALLSALFSSSSMWQSGINDMLHRLSIFEEVFGVEDFH